MPPNANAPTEGRDAAVNSVICAAKHATEIPHRPIENQVEALIDRREQALWQAFLLALEVDLIERSLESKLLRTLAHRTWGNAFLEVA